ncbi:NAD kinase 2, chloroplastic-like [Rutidosis leptorrhynchoides]|uniref:NAD kinase 2, chloroplastic-like n=1 Tax=Rutidosis leptorrhynchoides TaxID=125765 RepID=UPI003A9A4B69
MSCSSPVAGIHPLPPPSQLSNGTKLIGFRFGYPNKFKRRLKLVASAETSKSFSLSFGLDSQITQYNDPSQLPWVGPVPGDIAEVEAYCRIFRAAERLHAALMDTLCNPLTGECSIPYDFSPDDKPLLEDKIVSVLGCIISLLNKGRDDVLSGRSSIVSSFRVADVSMGEEELPPLAVFRGEMKRCCESLHVALENYLTPDDYRSLTVWRKLQRLKNVCYDSGFPRADDYPCHTLFANYGPVYLSTSKEEIEDSEVAFWKGGHVTEEGLMWLLERGFKTIVDLRAEVVKDNFYNAAINDAISSGKIEIVKIPVKVKTAPSMEQVEKFASLVSDSSKTPIYLHSKEGVRRTCAMVSRWKQFMSRNASQFLTSQPQNDILLQNTNGKGAVLEPSTTEERPFSVKKSELSQKTSYENHSSNGALHKDVSPDNKEGAKEGDGAADSISSAEMIDNMVESMEKFHRAIDPLKAQVPTCDVFSRKEMSRFFGSRKVSPPRYFNYRKGLKTLPVSKQTYNEARKSRMANSLPISGDKEEESSNGSVSRGDPTAKYQNGSVSHDEYLSRNNGVTEHQNLSGKNNEAKMQSTSQTNVSTVDKNKSLNYASSTSVNNDVHGYGSASTVSVDEDLESIEGNMCASATGVVRVQSRKKAEMFLVRTDGFSCTRERVTESSLAFTHPSTQQQMLMWKSTPKTVLLLKKLGQELLEEAKEFASFLYHQEKMNVLVEPDVHDIFARIPGFGFVQTFYTQDTSDLHERVDFVACLGGDGVILHASNLFRGAVPPVVSFNLGSLGFLTSHSFEDFRQDLRQVVHGNNTLDGVYITLRMRLRCEIFRNGRAVPGKIFDVLNEVVVDRGSNPYLSKIECYEHDQLITKVQGDGVIVATPTGSTAYSTAAGGSMVHPNVPCMLFTPICPHSLSFRPVILPDSARLELKIPDDARSNAWVSFDGKRRQQLSRGDSVRISMSEHPLPTVNKSDQTCDWFHSLIRCLNWNERLDQKAL